MLSSIENTRERLRQLRDLSKKGWWLTDRERLNLQDRRFWKAIRPALLMLQRRLERTLDGPFDPVVSQKLDAIRVLLED